MNLQKIAENAFKNELKKLAEYYLECEECGHREELDTEGIDAEECSECGGKMVEKED